MPSRACTATSRCSNHRNLDQTSPKPECREFVVIGDFIFLLLLGIVIRLLLVGIVILSVLLVVLLLPSLLLTLSIPLRRKWTQRDRFVLPPIWQLALLQRLLPGAFAFAITTATKQNLYICFLICQQLTYTSGNTG